MRAACVYCLVALVDRFLPINQGLARVVETTFRAGSVVDPYFPASVNTYMPTALTVAEAVLSALAAFVPEKRISGGSGSAALVLGGRDAQTQRSYVHYEIFSGGTGARWSKDGVSATAFHLSNCKTAPVEIIESEFPTRVERFEMIPDSGGAGRWRGGLGFARDYRILTDEVRFSMRTDKHAIAPFGSDNGLSGAKGSCIVNPGTDKETRLPSRFGDQRLNKGIFCGSSVPAAADSEIPWIAQPNKYSKTCAKAMFQSTRAKSDYKVSIRYSDSEPCLDRGETQVLRGKL